MKLSEEKIAHLRAVGFTDEMLEELKKELSDKAMIALDRGLVFKSENWSLEKALTPSPEAVDVGSIICGEVEKKGHRRTALKPSTMQDVIEHSETCSIVGLVVAFATEIEGMAQFGPVKKIDVKKKIRELDKHLLRM